MSSTLISIFTSFVHEFSGEFDQTQKLALQSSHHSTSIQMSKILIETVNRPKQMEWEADQFVDLAHITIKLFIRDENFADLLFLILPKRAEFASPKQREQKSIDDWALGCVCGWLSKIITVVWLKAAKAFSKNESKSRFGNSTTKLEDKSRDCSIKSWQQKLQ